MTRELAISDRDWETVRLSIFVSVASRLIVLFNPPELVIFILVPPTKDNRLSLIVIDCVDEPS